MVYKNIEIHNVVEVHNIEGREGVELYRVPQSVRNSLECGEQSQRIATNATGVELRFVMKSERVVLRLQKLYTDKDFYYSNVLHYMHIFYGNIQGTWANHALYLDKETVDVVIEKPNNLDTLKHYSEIIDAGFSADVVRVIFDGGYYMLLDVIGEVMPPSREQLPAKTLLTYGSSITHGSNSLDQSHAWAALLAKSLKMDLRNLGMAGACAMEKEMVDFIAELGEKNVWDVAILELGVNVVKRDNAYIYNRVKYTLTQIAGRNFNKAVYVISPLYSSDDYYALGNAVRWRDIIGRIVKELDYKNIEYIDGLSLIDNVSYLCADEVHPNIYGVQRIYEKLKERMKR